MREITIKYDDQSVEVFYNGNRKSVELAYVDKDTAMADIAQGFYELCSALQVECDLIEAFGEGI